MKAGAKSVVQIVLLLGLVAGAAFYFWPADSDLVSKLVAITDGIMGEKPATSPPSAAPTPPPNPIPPIPEQPAKGQLNGAAFAVQSAEIKSGVLTLKQDSIDLVLQLPTHPWEVPAGKNLQFVKPAAAAGVPVVTVRAAEEHRFADGYTLRLELAKERDGIVPGKIYLSLPDAAKSQVAGTFSAEVRGFRLIDGKPDLSNDSVDTLQYLALRELLKDDPDKNIGDVNFRQGRYDADAGPAGYLEVSYRLGDASAPMVQKYQFLKENGAWRTFGMLKPDQLDQAHPVVTPTAKDKPERLFPYLAGKRIETDAQKRARGQFISMTDVAVRYSDPRKVGVAEVSYYIGENAPVAKTFLYRFGKSGWTLARELNKNEHLNLATGKIEKRR